jgi:hypothetical protein
VIAEMDPGVPQYPTPPAELTKTLRFPFRTPSERKASSKSRVRLRSVTTAATSASRRSTTYGSADSSGLTSTRMPTNCARASCHAGAGASEVMLLNVQPAKPMAATTKAAIVVASLAVRPNGLQLSGARKGVRCSRGLGNDLPK